VIVQRPSGGTEPALVELRGELDLSTSEQLRRRLDATSTQQDLIVDVSAVPFIDSTALGILARAAVERREHDRRVVLVGAGHVVRKVLRVTRLGTVLPDVGTVQEAKELLGSSPGPA
jgi:anti-anti-sigma factor